ncbi:MAG TPA: hypothetical protein VM694_11970 [Polyangium sp.]|nr:hypothetical protein [Polyangium sp.]
MPLPNVLLHFRWKELTPGPVRQTAATLLAEEARRCAAEDDNHEPSTHAPPSRTRSPHHDG